MSWYRNPIFPLALAIIIGVIILFNFYVPDTVASQASSTLSTWATIMLTVTVWVGVINVVRHAAREAQRREPGRWYLAIFQIILVAVMLISGFAEGKGSTGRRAQTYINWLYNNYYIYSATGSAALVGLWAVTAAYRAFRARTIEAGLFLLGAVFTMLKNAPVGGQIWGGFPMIGQWIIDQPYTAMQRALTMGIGIAILGYALRYYTGRERASFGVVEE
jgi:hypothetical protein